MRYRRNHQLTLKSIGRLGIIVLFLVFQNNIIHAQSDTSDQSSKYAGKKIWVTAYFASWNHMAPPGGNWGNMTSNDIDWDAVTQIIYFALPALPDGNVGTVKPYENVNPDRVKDITAAAHSHSKPVLISIGGWGNYNGFSQAINDQNRAGFVTNLTRLITRWNFDGIDLDMEPIYDNDVNNYIRFVKELHQALQKITLFNGKKPLLTVATRWQPAMFAQIYQYVDQVNLMTYDLSGAWRGWVSWYNSAIYNGGHTFPGNNEGLPSVNKIVNYYLKAGVPAKKIGIGIDFYGYIWRGVSEPYKGWTLRAPTVEANVPFTTIINKYFKRDRYRWDDKAESAYLTINNGSNKLFITYDSRQTVRAKVDYALSKNLGGVFLWELGASYPAGSHFGNRDSLLESVKHNVNKHISQ